MSKARHKTDRRATQAERAYQRLVATFRTNLAEALKRPDPPMSNEELLRSIAGEVF